MSDYLIDLQTAIEAMSRISDSICEAEAVDALCELPTVDAVPVIRCKDCKWWRESDHTCRHFQTSPRIPMDYCSGAERKEE